MMPCKYPFYVTNEGYKFDPLNQYSHHKVPCGKCSLCKIRKSREWIFRLKEELKVCSSAYFVTLTYADDNLPLDGDGFPVLYKPDFQNYLKRLRKVCPDKLKYFACGEYGLKYGRPHYHLILFNAVKQEIEDNWTLGLVHIGTVTQDSMAYVAKYVIKDRVDSVSREFIVMSKGIGSSYCDSPAVRAFHRANLDKPYLYDEKGFKYPIPRYYRERLFDDQERAIVVRNVKNAMELYEEEFLRYLEGQGLNPYEKQVQTSNYEEFLFNKRLKQKTEKL